MCPYGELLVRMGHTIRIRITRAIKHNTKKRSERLGDGWGPYHFARLDVVKSRATFLPPLFKRDIHPLRVKRILGDFFLDGSASLTASLTTSLTQLIRTLLCSPCTRSTSSGSSRVADRLLLPSPPLLRRTFSTHGPPRTK